MPLPSWIAAALRIVPRGRARPAPAPVAPAPVAPAAADDDDYDAAAINAAYDEQTLRVMRRVLRPDTAGLDVGAHQGSILRHLLEIAPAGAHHAFEALPHLAADLRRQFPTVAVHEIAVADRAGTAEFLFVENDPGYSGLRARIYDTAEPRIVKLQVATRRIDDVVPAEQPIAFVKIDIEGGEYHALLGATRVVRRWRPVIVFEASERSTGQYGVTPDAMFDLVTDTLGCDLTTMARWLDGAPPYDRDAFVHVWREGLEFFFLAAPRDGPRHETHDG